MYFSLFILENLILIVFVLVNVAFITLMERKILGFSQLRLGPNKPSFAGLLQPMADAVKLFTKEYILNLNSHKMVFYASPMLSLLLVLSLWQLHPSFSHSLSLELSMILVMMLLGLNSYPTIFSGWSSSSKYTMLGSLRSVSQSISYEISLAFLLMSVIALSFSLNLLKSHVMGGYLVYSFLSPFLMLLIYISLVAETNRTPFDFAEGESELVSGFNTEYGGGGFALIFMAEYGSIYFLSGLISWFMLSSLGICYYILVSLMVFLWVWLRSTYPRYRYDLLMNLAWKSILPASLLLLIISLMTLL